jgi:acyl dehydratase
MALSEVLAELQAKVGSEIHVSDWLTVTQEMIDTFAEATGDHQWIHVDQERARAESPYGGTIAHGFLTLSLYPLLRGMMAGGAPVFPGTRNVINYGLNKLRFPNAVLAGSQVRGRVSLRSVDEVKDSLQLTEEYVVEVKGQRRPACVAEAIVRLYF